MMSDDEPPTKITKIELSSKHMNISEDPTDSQEEGQEEWLSEGAFTDDDYTAVEQDKYKSDSNLGNTSLDDTTAQSLNENPASVGEPLELLQDTDNANTSAETVDENIEQTLNKLDNYKNDVQQQEVDTFLIRKVGNKVMEAKTEAKGDDRESELDESAKQSDEDSDGHNTDELLKMLSEGNNEMKKKNTLKTVQVKKSTMNHDSTDEDDDDDYIFEGAKVTPLKVAKNVLMRKGLVRRARPERDDDEESDTDFSSDEANTVKNMFQMKKTSSAIPVKTVLRPSGPQHSVTIKKRIVKTPINKPSQSKPTKSSVKETIQIKAVPKSAPKPAPRPQIQLKAKKPEHEEIIDEEEFMEDDDFSLDEEEFSELREGDKQRMRQRIMKPEEMDEEVPTDGESHDEDDASFYDELPSSESEEMDDWFTLDIRAERAGDYLPLLGSKAYQLLAEEKKHVASRLSVLRQSLSALTESGKMQADKIRRATITLAELDAALAAS